MTIDDVCRKVGISRATLYKYIKMEGITINKSIDNASGN